ncbi:MAG: adenosylcobinamide-phosphate synthase CbiB [Chloroflexota bacterium]
MTVLLALLTDLALGDPPNRFHPTAWMGGLIAFLGRFRPHKNSAAEFLFGGLLMLVGLALAGGIGLGLARLFARLPLPLDWLLTALVLKTTFSLRGLDRAAGEVQAAIESDNLPEARRLLSWHLVSRDTSQLSAGQAAAAAIESIAENASDSLIAPLFFYALGGLPLALAYRFANTADAMLGYHDLEREWFGKIPARLDDVLNFIPARLTGLLLVCAAFVSGGAGLNAWKITWRDACLTESPNAGIPMSAMAGSLSIELEKIGHYRLGAGLNPPQITDLRRARRVYAITAALAAIVFSIFAFLVG